MPLNRSGSGSDGSASLLPSDRNGYRIRIAASVTRKQRSSYGDGAEEEAEETKDEAEGGEGGGSGEAAEAGEE